MPGYDIKQACQARNIGPSLCNTVTSDTYPGSATRMGLVASKKIAQWKSMTGGSGTWHWRPAWTRNSSKYPPHLTDPVSTDTQIIQLAFSFINTKLYFRDRGWDIGREIAGTSMNFISTVSSQSGVSWRHCGVN